MKPLALLFASLAVLALSPTSAAQDKPDSPRLGTEADRVEATTTVVRCDSACDHAAVRTGAATILAAAVEPRAFVWPQGDLRNIPIRGAVAYCQGICGYWPPPPPSPPAEVSQNGITVRRLGHPQPEPADE